MSPFRDEEAHGLNDSPETHLNPFVYICLFVILFVLWVFASAFLGLGFNPAITWGFFLDRRTLRRQFSPSSVGLGLELSLSGLMASTFIHSAILLSTVEFLIPNSSVVPLLPEETVKAVA